MTQFNLETVKILYLELTNNITCDHKAILSTVVYASLFIHIAFNLEIYVAINWFHENVYFGWYSKLHLLLT